MYRERHTGSSVNRLRYTLAGRGGEARTLAVRLKAGCSTRELRPAAFVRQLDAAFSVFQGASPELKR